MARSIGMNLVRNYIFILFILTGISACQKESWGEDLSLEFFRRSVLDQKTRMLTLGFGQQLWLAYDLQNLKPYKFWRGGVLWNGAVYNSVKTVQPTSFGNSYSDFSNSSENWKCSFKGEMVPVAVQYQSIAFEADATKVTLKYKIRISDGELLIYEKPQVFDQGDTVLFRRTFQIEGLGKDMVLYLGTQPIQDKGVISEKFAKGPVPDQPQEKTSGDGAQYWLDRSGCTTCHHADEKMIGPAYEDIANRYDRNEETMSILVERIKNGSTGQWGNVQMIPHPHIEEEDLKNMVKYILSLRTEKQKEFFQNPKKAVTPKTLQAGFGAPVVGVHPAFDLISIRPDNFRPRVGGLAFHSDGSLLVSTWDSTGAVYQLTNIEAGDSAKTQVKLIATGLAEPLGLTVVDNDIYVLQKHELTRLVDHNQDGVADEYECINSQFGVTTDFHEFSYGLRYSDGQFYGALGVAMRLMSSERQLEDRGTVFSVSNQTDFKVLTRGLRQPNGIGFGVDNQLFITENQGQWVPACKLIQVKPDQFYGCQFRTGDRFSGRTETPPAVWLPQDEIGNSPTEPILMRQGPYEGQMMHGDVTHGGIKRVFLEKINGEYQGCVFRFCQGLEAGINRLVYGPDGDLYAGGVGMNGGWSHQERQFGLQKLTFNGNIPFEMLSIKNKGDGFAITFTHPVDKKMVDKDKIKLEQWYYKATEAYGGPKLDQQNLVIENLTISTDGKTFELRVPGLRKGYVVYFLMDNDIKSTNGDSLWSGEAWYTLNNFANE